MQGLFPFVGMEESQSVISRPPGEPAPPLLSGEGSFEGSLFEAMGRAAGATKLSDAAALAGPARAGPPWMEAPDERRSVEALWCALAPGPGVWAEVVRPATSVQGDSTGVEEAAQALLLRAEEGMVSPPQPTDGSETAPVGAGITAAFRPVTPNSLSFRGTEAANGSPEPVLLPVEGYLDTRGDDLLLTLVAPDEGGGTARSATAGAAAGWPLPQEPAAWPVPLQVTVQLPAQPPGEETAGLERQALSTLLRNIDEWQPLLERLGASEVKIVSLGQLQQEALAEGRPLPFQAAQSPEVVERAFEGAASSAPTGVIPGSGKPVAFEAASEGAASSAPTGVVQSSGKPVAFEAAFGGEASSAPTGTVKPNPFSTVVNVMGDSGAVNPLPAETSVDGTAPSAGWVEALSEGPEASILVPSDGSKAVFEAPSAQAALPAGGRAEAGTGRLPENAVGMAQSEGVATIQASSGDARGWSGEIPVVDAPMQTHAFGEVSPPARPVRLTESEPASDATQVFPVSSTRGEALSGAGQAKSLVEASPAARDWQPVSEQITRQVRTALPEGRGEMQLRLEPPELGRLRLQVAVEDGRVTARFVTETRETHAMLRSHLSELQSALSEAGLRVQEVKLTLTGEGDSAKADSGGFGRGRQGLPQGFSQKAESGYGRPSSYAEEHSSPWEQWQPSLRGWEALLKMDGRSIDCRV